MTNVVCKCVIQLGVLRSFWVLTRERRTQGAECGCACRESAAECIRRRARVVADESPVLAQVAELLLSRASTSSRLHDVCILNLVRDIFDGHVDDLGAQLPWFCATVSLTIHVLKPLEKCAFVWCDVNGE